MMAVMRVLCDDVEVGGQITPADVSAVAARGVKSIICNRPDNEAAGQPGSADIEAAAKAAGLEYRHIPMAGNVPLELIETSRAAYADMPKPIVAYCGSGMRSTVLWCFACVKDKGVDFVLMRASEAGYELTHIRPSLEAYAR